MKRKSGKKTYRWGDVMRKWFSADEIKEAESQVVAHLRKMAGEDGQDVIDAWLKRREAKAKKAEVKETE